MHYEYAVDPALLNNWKDFRFFTGLFGWDKGRLISRYPSKWKKRVYEALTHCGELERARIEIQLKTVEMGAKLLPRSCTENKGDDWLTNALREHADSGRPFHAILAEENPSDCDDVLVGEGVDDAHPRLQVANGVTPRNAKNYASASTLLLRSAGQVVLVDPHVSPGETRFKDPLKAMLQLAFDPLNPDKPAKVTLVTGRKKDQAIDHRLGQLTGGLPRLIPAGKSLAIYIVEQQAGGEKLHNRYVLSEHAGIDFGIGLDVADAKGETDDLSRLTTGQHATRWEQYSSVNEHFKVLAGPVMIVGICSDYREARQ